MVKVFPALPLVALLASLSGCNERSARQEVSANSAAGADNVVLDQELERKMAEAKAAYEKLTPEEKKKLAEKSQKVASTLPLSLMDAGSIKLRPANKPEISLASVAPAGTPTIIAAWASWCIPCKLEARELAALKRRYAPEKLKIVYLNIGDPKTEILKGPEFLREAGAEQLGLTMLGQDDFLKLTRVDQLSVPRVLVYDRRGEPTEVISGAVMGRSDPRLANAIKKVTGA